MHYLWLSIGWVAFILGVIGILLPVMPTVPFMIVAAWAFAKSSPHMRERLMSDPRFGHQLRAWTERGAVGRWAKVSAIAAMGCGIGWSWFLGLPLGFVALQGLVCLSIAVFLITRPES